MYFLLDPQVRIFPRQQESDFFNRESFGLRKLELKFLKSPFCENLYYETHCVCPIEEAATERTAATTHTVFLTNATFFVHWETTFSLCEC